ncbi:SUN domain-containing ossification factor-like [Mizuhopecten yessoensis]|uniref:SUN domain-containing ossification factor-like n=1 Tax=Mizuhopecten yessoensis TaxID=6573 RepID=UPI000B45E12B|nr:SUN domain-containing ossification factor-like [Mizuhopecten yessoensis]
MRNPLKHVAGSCIFKGECSSSYEQKSVSDDVLSMFKEWTVSRNLTMKRKHSQWIIFMIVAELAILGVLSENDGATVAKVSSQTEKEGKSEAAEGETNIPVDPGGLQPDPPSGTTKDTQNIKSEDALDEKKSAVETEKDKEEEESNHRSNKSDTEKKPKELPPTPLQDGGDSGTATIANKDGHQNDQQSQGESVNHGEESVVYSDDQTTTSVNPSEAEDTAMLAVLSVTHTLEDIPASHIPETPSSEVVDSSTGVESLNTNKSDEKTDPEPVPVDPEFQTFTEFFEQNKQAEEEKKKQSKLTDMPGTDVLQMKQQKRVVNVASRECGAKIISSNPEAENPGGVLTSNKDDYMINPCKAAKKWFVIELCEPARVKSLEVASFELFSSQPHTFRVQFSEV